MKRGTILAVLIVVIGIAAGAWAIFARHNQMQHVLEAFTPATAEMIAHAPQVEMLQLVPDTTAPAEHAELMGIGDKVYRVAQQERCRPPPMGSHIFAPPC